MSALRPTNRPRAISREHRLCNRGFTAIEISMVIAVIAILALLILPMFQRRTDEARITATESDLRDMAIAMQLVNADTGLYFRLQDLDNTENFTTTNIDSSLDVPVVTWNDTLTADERATLAKQWRGPYISFKRTTTVADLKSQFPGVFFRSSGGPINDDLDPTLAPSIDPTSLDNDRIPVDPWGMPYLFYGTGRYGLSPGTETDFKNTLFVSLGPNGLPGDGSLGLTPTLLLRENFDPRPGEPGGQLGHDDDIFRLQ